jgi:hypothetical protein
MREASTLRTSAVISVPVGDAVSVHAPRDAAGKYDQKRSADGPPHVIIQATDYRNLPQLPFAANAPLIATDPETGTSIVTSSHAGPYQYFVGASEDG